MSTVVAWAGVRRLNVFSSPPGTTGGIDVGDFVDLVGVSPPDTAILASGTFTLSSTGVGGMCTYDEVFTSYINLSSLSAIPLLQIDYQIEMSGDRTLCPYMGGQITAFGQLRQYPGSSPSSSNQSWLPDQGNILPIGSPAGNASASSTFYTLPSDQFRFRLATDFAAIVVANGSWQARIAG